MENHAKGAVALDGYPGIGKTCAVETFASDFHLQEIGRHGAFTRTGDERWPVCRIGMGGNTSMKDFHAALCEFYAHPGSEPTQQFFGIHTTNGGKVAIFAGGVPLTRYGVIVGGLGVSGRSE